MQRASGLVVFVCFLGLIVVAFEDEAAGLLEEKPSRIGAKSDAWIAQVHFRPY